MKNWYSIGIGDGIMAAEPSEEIQVLFSQIFEATGMPVEMAVFTRHESEGRLHCEVVAYFSPAALEVAEAFDAQPCEKPARTGLGLLAGDNRAWSLLFDETIGHSGAIHTESNTSATSLRGRVLYFKRNLFGWDHDHRN
ncbi:MAG: hypothetical protein HYZ22_08490 [Chloroflexi bacterium]|nr:hypothetical protein [Chloroflexota bacterium]